MIYQDLNEVHKLKLLTNVFSVSSRVLQMNQSANCTISNGFFGGYCTETYFDLNINYII